MRTSQRAVIAIALALGALVVASVASASPPSSAPAAASQATSAPGHKPDGGSGVAGATCAIGVPDCDDTGIGAPGGDPGDDPGTGEPQIVEPTPGMDNVGQTAFDTATIGADDTTLTIVFWSGVEPCYVLDHVDVSYGAAAVTVTLFQGSDPNAGDVACIDIALQKQVTVTLSEPLAGRAIVDGAA
jgi:hypothetical protein